MHVVFVWKKRFVFREHAEVLSGVETQRETAYEATGGVNRGLQHPLTSLYILTEWLSLVAADVYYLSLSLRPTFSRTLQRTSLFTLSYTVSISRKPKYSLPPRGASVTGRGRGERLRRGPIGREKWKELRYRGG